MNFLAHMFLSCMDNELLIGNFLGDFISNKELSLFSEKIQEGVMLHRHIDSYSDNHADVLNSVRRLRPSQAKYAPVVVDVFYDFILANNWSKFTNQSLEEFSEYVTEVLKYHQDVFPEHVRKRTDRMIEAKWLVDYAKPERLKMILGFLDKRSTFPSAMTSAVEAYEKDYELYEQDFMKFFPDIIAQVEVLCKCH